MSNEEIIEYIEKKIVGYKEIREKYPFGDSALEVIEGLINNAEKKLEEVKDGK